MPDETNASWAGGELDEVAFWTRQALVVAATTDRLVPPMPNSGLRELHHQSSPFWTAPPAYVGMTVINTGTDVACASSSGFVNFLCAAVGAFAHSLLQCLFAEASIRSPGERCTYVDSKGSSCNRQLLHKTDEGTALLSALNE